MTRLRLGEVTGNEHGRRSRTGLDPPVRDSRLAASGLDYTGPDRLACARGSPRGPSPPPGVGSSPGCVGGSPVLVLDPLPHIFPALRMMRHDLPQDRDPRWPLGGRPASPGSPGSGSPAESEGPRPRYPTCPRRREQDPPHRRLVSDLPPLPENSFHSSCARSQSARLNVLIPSSPLRVSTTSAEVRARDSGLRVRFPLSLPLPLTRFPIGLRRRLLVLPPILLAPIGTCPGRAPRFSGLLDPVLPFLLP